MRTTQDFLDRQLERLPFALQRPAMCCGREACADLYYQALLEDLCWIEERRPQWDQVSQALLWGSRGVYGQLHDQDLQFAGGFLNEIASIYAQLAYRLGYFSPARVLTVAEFDRLSASLDAEFFSTDHTEGELVGRFGAPSHDVLGGQTTVHCYACEDVGRDWIYFDYSRCDPPTDRVTYEWFAEPMLRTVRRQRNRFEFTPFAAWCRPTVKPQEDGDFDDSEAEV